MMDHMEKNGKISAMVDGQEMEAETAEEQMNLFLLHKQQEEEAAEKKKLEEARKQAEEGKAAQGGDAQGGAGQDNAGKNAQDQAAGASGNGAPGQGLSKDGGQDEEEKGPDVLHLNHAKAKFETEEELEEEGKGDEEEKKANLWGGRFTKPTDKKVYDFNASIRFDRRLYYQDILGSMAHASMLGKVGVLTKEESESIIHALSEIQSEIADGKLEITDAYEDIHSFVEAQLIARLGDTGKKVHTGRSRNDQVALDMRMYIRGEVLETDHLVLDLMEVIFTLMKQHTETIMPGFTHLQKAQPTTLAHHLGAYFEMFKRDRSRLEDLYRRMNYCPLGSGAFAGTTYPLDRNYTAQVLGFYGPTLNSMDGVSDRDYLIDFLAALSEIQMHLSRFSEEIILWNSNEYQFVEIDDAYSTGSSIMPQKKNPDIAELVRGKTGRVYGALMSILTTMKGIPLAYNKDMQEDKEVAFDAIDTVKDCLTLFADMLATMKFNKERMEESAKHGFTNATDAADYLVGKGIPFRDAHSIIGRVVLYGIQNKKPIDDMSLEELRQFSDAFDEDVYDAIALKTCVDRRNTVGAPGKDAMEAVIAEYTAYLTQDWQDQI